jgi:hypothetical protein
MPPVPSGEIGAGDEPSQEHAERGRACCRPDRNHKAVQQGTVRPSIHCQASVVDRR